MSTNLPGTHEAELLIETFETDLLREYLPNDIFDAFSSEFINPQGDMQVEMPNAIYYKLEAEHDKSRTVKVPLIKELSASPTIGANGDQRGSEEDFETKYFRMEYTDISHATTNQNYGVYARDRAPYKIFEYRTVGLAKYFKQYFGKMRRQAICELQSENLEEAPHYNNSGISSNWWVPNRAQFSDQPVYTTDPEDWVDSVIATIVAAGTGINAAASIAAIQQLEEWARTEGNITPINFSDGTDGYILTMPTPQCTWLNHPVQSGQFPGWVKDVHAIPKEVKQEFPGFRGRVGGIVIVEDIRYPTLTIGGSASNSVSYLSDSEADYTATIQYRGMGRADDGSSDPRDKSATARMLSMLLGQHAICEWMPENFHWEWEYQQYDKYFGSGIFCSVGIKQMPFDQTGGDETTLQQDGSVVIPWAQPPRTNYYSSATA